MAVAEGCLGELTTLTRNYLFTTKDPIILELQVLVLYATFMTKMSLPSTLPETLDHLRTLPNINSPEILQSYLNEASQVHKNEDETEGPNLAYYLVEYYLSTHNIHETNS